MTDDYLSKTQMLFKKFFITYEKNIFFNLILLIKNANKRAMDSSKEIKDWLKRSGKKRQWLADQCYVSKSTIDCWLAPTREIPPAKLAYIKTLMADDTTPHPHTAPLNYDSIISVPIRLTPDEWNALLPPHLDPQNLLAAENYIRNLLQSVVDDTPPMPRPPDNHP